MKWKIYTIGKPSLAYAKSGVAEYVERLRRYTTLEVVNVAKEQGEDRNSEALLKASEGAYRIALDERGESITTLDLAGRVENWQMLGMKDIAFLIGGADGHNFALREKSDLVMSLSSLTMQHELALLVLLEQIYRVHTILKGEPYHRS